MPAPHRVPYGCLHISHGNAFWCVNRSGSRHRRSNIGQRIGFPCGNYEPALFVEAPYQTVAGTKIVFTQRKRRKFMLSKKATLIIAKLCFCIVSIGIISARSATISADAKFFCPPNCLASPHGGCLCP